MASALHIYSSFGDEFPTDALRRAAFAEGKRVFAPVTPPDGSPYLFHVEIFPDTRFIPDSFGIPTPVSAAGAAPLALEELLCTAAPDLVITPLLGFDAALHRIGYGKGYYDRFLSELRRRSLPPGAPFIVGVAFYEAQFWNAPLPAEAHDVPMDCVATENGVISKRF
jgi:5-formyltetrahydrofolate cyclo-ligase